MFDDGETLSQKSSHFYLKIPAADVTWAKINGSKCDSLIDQPHGKETRGMTSISDVIQLHEDDMANSCEKYP